MKRFALVLFAASLVSTLAVASSPKEKQVALPVGHSMTMAMPAAVTGVRVNDPALVEVRRQGRKVTLVALAQGSTEATVTTAEGSHRFRVYVAADKYAMPH